MKKLICAIFLAVVLGGIGSLPAMPVSRDTDETHILYQNVPSQSKDFQTNNGTDGYHRSSTKGPSGVIPLPNAQGNLNITLLE